MEEVEPKREIGSGWNTQRMKTVTANRRHKATRKEWIWTPQRDTAAELLAIDAMTDTDIAKSVQIGVSTLWDWKLIPDFIARVEENRARLRAEAEADRQRIRTTGFAIIEERVKRKNERLRQLEEIRIARSIAAGTDPEWLVQGGSTGLIIRKERSVGNGPMAQIVTDFTIDTSLISAESALDEAIAKELGQHILKQEIEVVDNSAAAQSLDEKIDGLVRRLANAPQSE